MTYWKLYVHLVWATKDRMPALSDEFGRVFVDSVRGTCHELGIVLHAIAWMPDHVHLAISHPPKLALSETVHALKGRSSRNINLAAGGAGRFSWQPEYGVLSFGERSLDRIVSYVANQPSHHANDTLWPIMETWSNLPSLPRLEEASST